MTDNHSNSVLDQLVLVSSKFTRDMLVDYIGEDQHKLFVLWKIIKENDRFLSNRGTWVLYSCFQRHPDMVRTYLKEFIIFLEKCVDSGAKRNLLKIIAESPVNIYIHSEGFIENCFDWLQGDEPVSVKIQSMRILYQISQLLPEIKHELIFVLEAHLDHGSVGFKNSGTKMINLLRKQMVQDN